MNFKAFAKESSPHRRVRDLFSQRSMEASMSPNLGRFTPIHRSPLVGDFVRRNVDTPVAGAVLPHVK